MSVVTEELRPDTYYILLLLVKVLGHSDRPLHLNLQLTTFFCG